MPMAGGPGVGAAFASLVEGKPMIEVHVSSILKQGLELTASKVATGAACGFELERRKPAFVAVCQPCQTVLGSRRMQTADTPWHGLRRLSAEDWPRGSRGLGSLHPRTGTLA